MADISKGDMQAANNLVDEEDDLHISEEEDDEADKMSLASDLDEEDLEEVQQREKELEKKTLKKKQVLFVPPTFFPISFQRFSLRFQYVWLQNL